jgi:hypothetical protein
MSDKKTLKQEYTERLRKYERELSLKLRANTSRKPIKLKSNAESTDCLAIAQLAY